MPTIRCSYHIKEAEEDFGLSLNARHCLLLGSSDQPVKVVGHLPEIDVLPQSDLCLSISGMRHDGRVDGMTMQRSYPVQHLVDFLKTV